jgi:oligosaccharide repeat unit polymerase
MAAERLVALMSGLILAGGALKAAHSAKAKLGSFVDPLVVFLSAWAVALCVFSIPWINYTHSSFSAWVAVYGSIISFAIGSLVAYRLTKIPQRSTAEQVNERALIVLWLITLALGLVGFFAYLHAVDVVLGWKAVFSRPDMVRAIQTTSPKFTHTYGLWKLLTYFNLAAFLLWSMALRIRMFRGRRLVVAPLGLLAACPFLFTGDRTLLLTLITWTVIFHLIWRPPTNPRVILALILAVGVVVVVAFIVLANRVDKKIETHPEVATRLTTQRLREFALLYVYITSETPALSQLMADPIRPRTDGAMTFLPAVKLAHAAGLAGTPPEEVGAYYPVPFETFNLYSWLGSFYLDYGLAGCIVLPALVAFFFTLMGIWALRRRTLLGVWVLSLAMFIVAWTPFHNKISTTLTWQLLGLGIVVTPLIRRRSVARRAVATDAFFDLARRSPAAVAAAGLLVVLALAGVGVAVAASQRRTPNVDSTLILKNELKEAAGKAHRVFDGGEFPSSLALASQLHVSDPRFLFLPLASIGSLPSDPGTIGVFAARTTLWLRTFTRNGVIIELRQDEMGSNRAVRERLITPRRNLTRDSGFESPVPRWFISQSRGARAEIDRSVSLNGKASLKIAGTGKPSDGATVATQLVTNLPTRSAGSVYLLTLMIRTKRLPHSVPAELKFLYGNGAYEFFSARPRTPQARAGHGKATARSWVKLEARGVARRNLVAVEIFAADTGVAATARGSQWIDEVELFAQPFTLSVD